MSSTKNIKRRFRKTFRRHKRKVENVSIATDQTLDKHLIKRLIRLVEVRRFVLGWIALFVILIISVALQNEALSVRYEKNQPVSGGKYIEGMVGAYTDANPIYASGSVDASIAKLIFAGLYKYDDNSNLVPDLASGMKVEENNATYTVSLKPELKWHDGAPLTADDVVFTFNLIQNPDVKSFLDSGWRGVKINKIDDQTVSFVLPNKYAPFPHSLTTGILPKHILEKIPPDQLRSDKFNTISPIGSGPFILERVQVDGDGSKRQTSVGLIPFKDYYAGKPKINRLVIKTFNDEEQMIKDYEQRKIDAMVGLTSLPDKLEKDTSTKEYTPVTLGEVMVFFKTSQKPLDDRLIRKALVLSIDKPEVLSKVGYPLLPISEPILPSQIGYNQKLGQKTGNKDLAKRLFLTAGWKIDPASGLLKKNGKTLSFTLVSKTNSEYSTVIRSLQKQWKAMGVDVRVILQNDQELQSTVASHNYDALLYAISLGADPDSFAFWHGSQADVRSPTRLNFSEYKSKMADQSLEAGRTRYDKKIRAVKYQEFLKQWKEDNPALALYQPRFLYVARDPLYGFNVNSVVSAADRFNNVHNWAVKVDKKY